MRNSILTEAIHKKAKEKRKLDFENLRGEEETRCTQNNLENEEDLYACKKLKCKSPLSSPGSNLRMNSSDWGSGKSSIKSKLTFLQQESPPLLEIRNTSDILEPQNDSNDKEDVIGGYDDNLDKSPI